MQNDWSNIVPLDNRETPPYPVHALPEKLAEYSSQVAESLQVPVDLPAQLCLSVISAATARVAEIQITQDWREPLNLYVAAILPSGQRKSAVFREITRPLERAERERQHGQAQGARRLLVDDVTPEQLATLLAANRGRIALMSPEGGVFDMMAGRYSGGIPNLDVYLKGHAGDTIRIDRKDKEGEIIVNPCLSVALTIQPEILKAMALQPGFRGRGLLARFLYSYPTSLLGHRKIGTKPVNLETRDHFYKLVKGLLEWRDEIDADLPQTAIKLRLDSEAETVFKSYCETIELSLAPDGDLSLIGDWGGKLTGAVARIAGILHLSEFQKEALNISVPAITLQNAIAIGDYLRGHALLAFDAMGIDPAIEGARRILEWVSRNSIESFSERELFQDTKGWFKRMAALRLALSVLEEHSYVRILARNELQKKLGRKSGPDYEVNPALTQARKFHAQNTQNQTFSTIAKKTKEFWGF